MLDGGSLFIYVFIFLNLLILPWCIIFWCFMGCTIFYYRQEPCNLVTLYSHLWGESWFKFFSISIVVIIEFSNIYILLFIVGFNLNHTCIIYVLIFIILIKFIIFLDRKKIVTFLFLRCVINKLITLYVWMVGDVGEEMREGNVAKRY